jgi:hypothetical protein
MNDKLLSLVSIFIFSVVTFVSGQPDKKPDPNISASKRPVGILEKAEWVQLFNGKDLSGWNGDTEKYVARDGMIVCEKGARLLRTDKHYGDFAFSFEFKLEESGNNGIGIRVPEGGHPSRDGMEIQILDHNGSRYNGIAEIAGKQHKLSWLKPWQYHGSIYGVYPAKTGYLKPPGEWNQETIIAIEDHIMVILNGAVIVDTFLENLTPVGNPNNLGYKSRSGQIVLAGHSDYVEFKNLKIVDYQSSPPSPKTKADNTPPAGFEALFNGSSLCGWKGLAHNNANERRALSGQALQDAQSAADETMKAHWSVVDGVLTYDGKGQSLCTQENFGDFELYIDWKIPPGADSGIYLRGTPQVGIWDPWKPQSRDNLPAPANSEEWVQRYRHGQNQGSGSLWNNRRHRHLPIQLADKKAGEWNTFFIRMVGEKVSVWLNNSQVVDRTVLENYWDKERKQPLPRADQIELQHHGSELFFKNLYIKELPY